MIAAYPTTIVRKNTKSQMWRPTELEIVDGRIVVDRKLHSFLATTVSANETGRKQRTTRWTKVLNSVDFKFLANPFGLGHRQRSASRTRPMSQNAWRTLRTLIRYFVYAGSGLVVLFAIMICLSFPMNPFAGFAGQSEFSDLAGHSAKRRLSDWPSNVDPRDVQNVSYKSQYSRDSYSTWYRITLSDNAAERWTNQIHKTSRRLVARVSW